MADKVRCAVLESGELKCWGNNEYGAVGVPGKLNVPAPTTIDIGGAVLRVDSANSHNCAVLLDHSLRCWGSGIFGRLGTGSPSDVGLNQTPAEVDPIQY